MRKLTFWASLLFVFVVPWENVIMFEGGDTFGRLVGIIAAGIWLLAILVTGQLRVPLPFHVAVFAFMIWNVTSLLWSADPSRTFDRAQTYLQLAILIFMLWDIYSDPKMVPAALQAYVLGAFITAGSTLYNYLNASEYYYNRYAASGFNPNDAGLILALGIPLAWHLATEAGEQPAGLLRRTINFLYLPAALFAIFLTGSRGTLVAASASFFFILATLLQLRPKLQLLLLGISLSAAVAVATMIPPTSVERILNKGVTLNGREDVWSQSLALILERPLLGVGSGATKRVIEAQQSAHNFVLSIGGETGLIGLALFAFVLFLVFLHAWRNHQRYRYLWLTMLFIWILGASVHNWEHRKQTWLLFSLVVISSSVAATNVTSLTGPSQVAISSSTALAGKRIGVH